MLHDSGDPSEFCDTKIVVKCRRSSKNELPKDAMIFGAISTGGETGLKLPNAQIDVSCGSVEYIRCIWAQRMQICMSFHKITFFRSAEGFYGRQI